MLKFFYPFFLLFISFITVAESTQIQASSAQPALQTTKSPSLSEDLIAPFEATYSILHKSKEVGTAIRKLEKLTDNNYRYSYTTDIEWLIFDDKRTEESLVSIKNNYVIPQHYKYAREGTGRDKFYEWSYNVADNSATNLKKNETITLEFPENIQDSLSYHLQHRLNLIKNPEQKDFLYSVIKSSGSLREYAYEYDGEEEVMLPYGLINTIKLKREVKDKKRVTYAWFAPELDYLLVRLYQIKNGTQQFEAQLMVIDTALDTTTKENASTTAQ